MLDRPSELAALAFRDLVARDEVEFISEDGDLHIVADDWTLVLEGDPISDVLIALEDEEGSPESALREAISEEALIALSDLNAQLEGDLISLLLASPDILATALAELLES